VLLTFSDIGNKIDVDLNRQLFEIKYLSKFYLNTQGHEISSGNLWNFRYYTRGMRLFLKILLVWVS